MDSSRIFRSYLEVHHSNSVFYLILVIRAQKLAPRGQGGFADPAVRVYKGGKVEHMYESSGTFLSLGASIICQFSRPFPAVTVTDPLYCCIIGPKPRLIRSIQCGMRMWYCTFDFVVAVDSYCENVIVRQEN